MTRGLATRTDDTGSGTCLGRVVPRREEEELEVEFEIEFEAGLDLEFETEFGFRIRLEVGLAKASFILISDSRSVEVGFEDI